MELVWVLVILAALLIWYAWSIKNPHDSSRSTEKGISLRDTYAKIESLFSPAERSFLGVLDQACGQDFRVLGKVRVADVVQTLPVVRQRLGQKAWWQAFNKVSSKHFDFVLCHPDTLITLGIIELDDRSHELSERQARDAFLEELCLAIRVPLIRIPVRAGYSVQQVRDLVMAQLRTAPLPVSDPVAFAAEHL